MRRPLPLLFTFVSLGCDEGARTPSAEAAPITTEVAPSAAPTAHLASPSASITAGAAPSASAAPTAPVDPGPARVESIDVPGHLRVSIVRARDGKPPRIVFYPGICSNAGAYLHGFTEAAAAHGGAIAIDGEKPCGAGGDFHSISSDPLREEPRLDAALDAAGVPQPARSELLHVGYSLGATLLENLVKKSPERYRHVALIGSPKDPRKDRLEKATTVATMSCSLDVPARMKGAVKMLEQAGVRARYFEMPGCTHGNLADGDRVFGELFTWMRASP